jgi:hypothetical protein
MIPAFLSRAWGYVAAAGAALAVVAWAFLRGVTAGRDAVRADAARRGAEAQARAAEAARAAEREGAAERLRDGRF